MNMNCYQCGTCCTVFDISTLKKPAGVACSRLGADGRCTAYETRPDVCRAFRADELCVLISTLTPEERMAVLQYVYYGE